ncbi:hypothetical protein D3C78_926490 [compost metagenome]
MASARQSLTMGSIFRTTDSSAGCAQEKTRFEAFPELRQSRCLAPTTALPIEGSGAPRVGGLVHLFLDGVAELLADGPRHRCLDRRRASAECGRPGRGLGGQLLPVRLWLFGLSAAIADGDQDHRAVPHAAPAISLEWLAVFLAVDRLGLSADLDGGSGVGPVPVAGDESAGSCRRSARQESGRVGRGCAECAGQYLAVHRLVPLRLDGIHRSILVSPDGSGRQDHA